MKHKLWTKVTCLVCLLPTLLCGCRNKYPVPDFPLCQMVTIELYEDEAQILEHFPNLILGKVKKVKRIAKPNPIENRLPVKTFTYIQVERTLKGDIPENKTIIVSLDGDGENYMRSDIQNSGGYYAEGDTALLFLSELSESGKANYKEEYRKQYRKDRLFPYGTHSMQGRFWVDEEGNILHERNISNVGLFTDCATVDELAEKYGLN